MEGSRSHDWLTTSKAARRLGYTVQHTRLLIRGGKIVGERVGRDWLVTREAIDSYLANRYEPQKPAEPSVVRSQTALFDDPELQPIVNVSSVPQRSPFRYPGGKTWLIPHVRMWLGGFSPKPRVLIEPFAGGGGIGLMAACEHFVDSSVLVELDPDVAAVWKAMLSDSYKPLINHIIRFRCEERFVREELDRAPASEFDRAFQTILRNRVSRGGILAPGAGLVKTGEANKGIASRWYPETIGRRIQAIYEQRDRISFREADGLDVLQEYANDPDAVFFVDPPYPVAGRRLYRYHDLDHEELFARLASIQGRFLATYDHSPRICELAERFGFEWKLVPMKSTHHTRKLELMISRDVSFLSAVS